MITRRHFLGVSSLAAAGTLTSCQREGDEARNAPGGGPMPPSIAALPDRSNEATPISVPDREGRIEKAYVFLPRQPQVGLVSGARREVGAPVKLVIAVHELFHACGLENEEHCPSDLFHPGPDIDPGSTPAQDRARITYSLRMPPLRLSEVTAGRVRGLWSS